MRFLKIIIFFIFLLASAHAFACGPHEHEAKVEKKGDEGSNYNFSNPLSLLETQAYCSIFCTTEDFEHHKHTCCSNDTNKHKKTNGVILSINQNGSHYVISKFEVSFQNLYNLQNKLNFTLNNASSLNLPIYLTNGTLLI